MRRSLFAILGVGALLLTNCLMFAQAAQSVPAPKTSQALSDDDINMLRADIREMRKKVTAANVTLTAAEATKFWPIYDQYLEETIKINDERWALIKDYAANYNNMTDQVAKDYMTRSAEADQRLIALRSKYVPIFQNAV